MKKREAKTCGEMPREPRAYLCHPSLISQPVLNGDANGSDSWGPGRSFSEKQKENSGRPTSGGWKKKDHRQQWAGQPPPAGGRGPGLLAVNRQSGTVTAGGLRLTDNGWPVAAGSWPLTTGPGVRMRLPTAPCSAAVYCRSPTAPLLPAVRRRADDYPLPRAPCGSVLKEPPCPREIKLWGSR